MIHPSHQKPHLGILCLSKSFGGLELHTLKLAQWLKDRGWRVMLFLLPDSPMEEQADKQEIPVAYARRKWKFDVQNAYLLHKRLQELSVDLLIVTHNKDISLAALVKQFWQPRLKVVYQQHMQIGVNKKDFLHTMRFAAIDAWVTPLHWLEREVREKTNFNHEKVRRIPIGMEMDKFTRTALSAREARAMLGIDSDAVLLGILGRIDPKKGQDFLIEALHSLQGQTEHRVELLIMGEPTRDQSGDYEAFLKNKIEELGLQDKVHFRGFTSRTEVFYKAIDIFVMASTNETYGLVTIEAMASGVPVVATDVGGSPEILRNGQLGLLYPPRNQSAFIAQVLNYLENSKQRNQIRLQARQEAVKTYSHLQQCESMEALFYELAAAG